VGSARRARFPARRRALACFIDHRGAPLVGARSRFGRAVGAAASQTIFGIGNGGLEAVRLDWWEGDLRLGLGYAWGRYASSSTRSSIASAFSSVESKAKVSSETRICRALANMCFSPADSPFSFSRAERFRTTSATW